MGKGTLPPIPMGYQPYQPDEEIPPLPSGYSAEPVKKKVGGEDLSNGGTNGSFAGLLGGSVKGANIGSAAIKKLPIEDISEYNKRFEDITGHKEINLGSDLPQIAKAREEKKYLTYRDIEENQIKPVLNDVASGVVQSEDLKKLYQQPYGKKIVSEVINQNLPEIGTMGLDEDVFGNEKKWEAIAQSIQSKNRQQGVDAQNQQEFELDNELANSLKDYTYGQDHIAVRGGGEAVNERQQKAFGIVNTTSPSELSAALRNINNSSKVWDSEGNEVDKKLLAKKIGTRLFQIKAQEDIHPEITQLSDKVKSAISKVPVEWKKQGMTDELLNRDAEYVIDGLNYIRDSDPGRYAMIMGTIYKLDKIAETDYQELVGLGKEINSFKKFKQGEYVEKDNRNFLTPQGKKALLGGWLYEELKRTGKNKQTFRIPQKDILEAYKNVPAELKDDDLLRDIIKDEVGPAFGFLPIAKGEGIPKRGLGRQILTNTADPFAGILKTADYSFDSPFDAYLKSKELDRGDNIVLNSKGEYTNKSSDTFFNKAVGGLFSFLSQVGIARGIGAVTAKGTNALIGQVAPRAATVTTSEAALNVGTPLSVIAQQYGDEYVDFLEKTGNPTKAALGAFVSTVTQGAIERFVLPDVKIADQAALLFARKNLAKDIINVVENGGGKVGVLKTIKDFTANTLSTLSKEAIAEENLQNFANYLTEMVVSPKTAQNRDLMQETEDITKAAVVQMAIPAVLGGAGETKIKRGLNKVQLNHIGVNAEDYQKALDNQFAMGKMLQEDYDLASGIIQLHRDNIINAPKYDSKGELISAERQLEYAYQSTVQETLQKQAEKQRDKIQREPIEKKIEEADKIKRQIFYGEEAEGLPPKEGQPITIDQDRDLMDEEGQDLSKDELLATLKSKAGELEQGMDLQYFKDKAAEDPAKYIGKYGEETVMKLIESVPTETLQGNLDLFIEMNPDNPSVKILDNIIAKREQSKNPPIDQVRELADENTPNESAGVSGSALKDVEGKKADIERRRQEELNTNTSAGYGVIAADYLFTGGRGSMLSTDYLLQALTASFPFAGKQIDAIRNKYAGKLGNISDDVNSKSYNDAIAEIRNVINTIYQNSEIESLFNEILNNSTGFISREGNRVNSRLEALNEEHENKINAKYDAELAALEETSGVSGSALKDVESTAKALEIESKNKPTIWEQVKQFIKDTAKKVGNKLGIISNEQHLSNFEKAKADWDKLSSREKKLKRADYELDDLHHTEGGYYKVGDSLIDLDLNASHLKLLLENNKFLNILNKLGVNKIHGENRPPEEMFAHYSDNKIHLNNNSAFENIRQVTNAMSHELGHHEWTKLTKEERDYVRSLPIETGMAKHYEAQEKNGGKQTSASLQEENFADYVMQYFQGKLYGDESLLNKIPTKLREMFDNKYSDLLKDNEHSEVAEAYHKAKADGTNPELVKAVEDLLGKAPTQYTEAAGVSGSALKDVDEKVVKSRVKRIAKSLNVDEQRSQQIHDIALKAKDYEDFKKQVSDLIGDNKVNENRIAEQYDELREEAKSEYEKELERNLEDLRASYGEAQRADTGLKKITEKSPTSVRNFINRILNGTTPESVAQAKARLVEMQRKYRKEKADMRAMLPRERGVNFVIEKLSKAARNGDITQEGADLAIDLIRKQPNMFEDLAISITKGNKELNGDGVQGWYRAADALVKIFKNPKDPLTATHELLHHTERYLPQEVRDGITKEWYKQIQIQAADIAKKLKTETNVDKRQQLTQGLLYLGLAEARQTETNSANVEAMERIMSKYLGDHTDSKGNFHKGLGDTWYQLYNPSEWWAVNASKIFRDAQNKPELKTWVDKAKAFYNYLIDSAKKIFKGNPTANVEKGLKTILKGEALEDREGTMLSQSKRLLNIKQKGSFEDRLKSIYDEVNKSKAPTQYTEAATPKEQAQKIADLTEKRDRDIAVASKPDVKLEFVSAKELVDSKDPIGNRNIHNDIKERFKKLKEILDCIHG